MFLCENRRCEACCQTFVDADSGPLILLIKDAYWSYRSRGQSTFLYGQTMHWVSQNK